MENADKIQRLVSSMNLVDTMGPLVRQALMAAVIESAGEIADSDLPKFSRVADEIIQSVMTRLPELATPIGEAMFRVYSDDEIDHLIAFYDSELGKRVNKKIPVAMEKVKTVCMAWAAGIKADIEPRIREIVGATTADAAKA